MKELTLTRKQQINGYITLIDIIRRLYGSRTYFDTTWTQFIHYYAVPSEHLFG